MVIIDLTGQRFRNAQSPRTSTVHSSRTSALALSLRMRNRRRQGRSEPSRRTHAILRTRPLLPNLHRHGVRTTTTRTRALREALPSMGTTRTTTQPSSPPLARRRPLHGRHPVGGLRLQPIPEKRTPVTTTCISCRSTTMLPSGLCSYCSTPPRPAIRPTLEFGHTLDDGSPIVIIKEY